MIKEVEKYYERLVDLKYSKENIAELYSIINSLIKFLENIDSSRESNECLHFILITKEKEFERFDRAPEDEWESHFKEAKSNLLSDLSFYCLKKFREK